MTLSFRRATEEDIPLLRSLAGSIWRTSYEGVISIAQVEYMLARMYAVETIAKEMGAGVVWELAMEGEMPRGFLACKPEPGSDRVKLEKVYLAPELQGQGLGQQMISRALAIGAELGARHLWLQVNKHNARARRAYERAGFHIEREAVFDIGGGFVMDDFLMARAIAREPS